MPLSDTSMTSFDASYVAIAVMQNTSLAELEHDHGRQTVAFQRVSNGLTNELKSPA